MTLLDDLPSLYNLFPMPLMDMLHIYLDSSHLELHFSICNNARSYLFHFINKHTTDATFCIFEKKIKNSLNIINMKKFIENQASDQSL